MNRKYMEWAIVIGLVVLGLVLLILEFIFIPGTTVIGFIGLVATGCGIYLGYSYFGNTIGTGILLSTGGATLATLYFSLKSGAWERFSLKGSIRSKVNEDDVLPITGDIGITTSSLRPVGNAEFDGQLHEVASRSGFVERGKKVRIIKIESRKIWVEEAKEFQ